jgi:hypothetical protein
MRVVTPLVLWSIRLRLLFFHLARVEPPRDSLYIKHIPAQGSREELHALFEQVEGAAHPRPSPINPFLISLELAVYIAMCVCVCPSLPARVLTSAAAAAAAKMGHQGSWSWSFQSLAGFRISTGRAGPSMRAPTRAREPTTNSTAIGYRLPPQSSQSKQRPAASSPSP